MQKVNFLLYLRRTVDITEYRLLVVTYPAVYLNCIYIRMHFFYTVVFSRKHRHGVVLLLHACTTGQAGHTVLVLYPTRFVFDDAIETLGCYC
jgi:hypothetical protein